MAPSATTSATTPWPNPASATACRPAGTSGSGRTARLFCRRRGDEEWDMRYRLIMLVGSSPGAGKSTLSEFLYEQLTCHAIPAQWMYEDDILYIPAFAQFIKEFQSGHTDTI